MNNSPLNWKRIFLTSFGITLAVTAMLYGEYRYLELEWQKTALEQNAAVLQKEIAGFEQSLATNRTALEKTAEALQTEQGKNNVFESQINQLSGTVTTLQKLTATDPQLLKKYSKIYFLNENYVPATLSAIDSQYLFDKNRPELILSGVLSHIEGLLGAAKQDGIMLEIVSAYRSFYEQASLKWGYKVIYGSGTANQFSAEQGYSEHQLGTAVDFSTPEVGSLFSKFAASPAYRWLTDNAYRFGFVLSYPPDNTYYQFESWHWRYVGVKLATALHENREYFYNLSQYDIDQYLASFFD